SGHRGLPRVVVHLESVLVQLHALMTRASYFRRRCARRRVILKTTRYMRWRPGHLRLISLRAQALMLDVQALSTSLSTKSVDKAPLRNTPDLARRVVDHHCIHPHPKQQTDLHQALKREAP
ncbi:hypothetical protein, partial [Paraburkholderia sediminicola]|uniref:hypothetical protein n=1 Tax=Paraburkholderia sediminicola TaxID=458836 RepID=UPI0038BA88A5